MNIDIDDSNGLSEERMIRVDLLLIARPIKNKRGLKIELYKSTLTRLFEGLWELRTGAYTRSYSPSAKS